MVLSVYFVMYKEHLVNFRDLALNRIWESWQKILHVGLPSMASSLVAPLTTAFITHQVALFGQEAVAGFGVASRVEGVAMMSMMALSAAMTPFVGQNFGARRLDRVEEGIGFAYRFSLTYGLGMAAVVFLLAPYIAAVFTSHPAAQHAAIMQMRIVPLGYLALGVSMTVNGAFNAMGKPMAAMFVSLSRTILVYAPLAWILSNLFGLIGIYIAACTASFASGGIGFVWLRIAMSEKLAAMKPAEQQA
jgi:Na+-driven multidrug efflux pump